MFVSVQAEATHVLEGTDGELHQACIDLRGRHGDCLAAFTFAGSEVSPIATRSVFITSCLRSWTLRSECVAALAWGHAYR